MVVLDSRGAEGHLRYGADYYPSGRKGMRHRPSVYVLAKFGIGYHQLRYRVLCRATLTIKPYSSSREGNWTGVLPLDHTNLCIILYTSFFLP